jgi:hypothetical protein
LPNDDTKRCCVWRSFAPILRLSRHTGSVRRKAEIPRSDVVTPPWFRLGVATGSTWIRYIESDVVKSSVPLVVDAPSA